MHRARCRGGKATRRNRVGGIGGLVLHEQTVETESPAQATGADKRCPALAEADWLIETLVTFEERKNFAVSPQRRLAPAERRFRPALRARQVVPREQGSAATAQMVRMPRVVGPGSARHRALEMGKKCGHVYFPRRSASFFFCKSSIVVTCWSVTRLHVVERTAFLVFRNLVILEQLLEPVVGVAADLAHGIAPFLGVLVHDPRQLLAALLGERGDRNPDDLAVRRRVETEVALLNRALDGGA